MLIDGTFIQLYKVINKSQVPLDWTELQWETEISWMKTIGFQLIIIQFSAFDNQAYYPSNIIPMGGKHDQIDIILSLAQKMNMQVMVGLTLESTWWKGVSDSGYFQRDLEKNIKIANELWDKYSHYSSFWGWYIPHEIDDTYSKPDEHRKQITDLLEKMTAHLHQLSPGKPVGIAPYYSMNMTPQEYEQWWLKTLSAAKLDIMMLQDGVGCHRPNLDRDIVPYYQAMQKACQKTGVEFWSDLEIFDQIHCPPVDNLPLEHWDAMPAALERIKRQIFLEEPFVSRIVCFEFTHYMSPQMGIAQRKLYDDYKQWITLKEKELAVPK